MDTKTIQPDTIPWRKSAVGLPFIDRKMFGGREYAVTEYTMSEIVASIYNKIEDSGLKEGILFIDEINCVSETLAPTMLQFLQCKTFGSHRIPAGWTSYPSISALWAPVWPGLCLPGSGESRQWRMRYPLEESSGLAAGTTPFINMDAAF